MMSRRGFFGACAAAAGAAVAAPLLAKEIVPKTGLGRVMGFDFIRSGEPWPRDGAGYEGYTLHTRIAARSIDSPDSGRLLFHQIMVR